MHTYINAYKHVQTHTDTERDSYVDVLQGLTLLDCYRHYFYRICNVLVIQSSVNYVAIVYPADKRCAKKYPLATTDVYL